MLSADFADVRGLRDVGRRGGAALLAKQIAGTRATRSLPLVFLRSVSPADRPLRGRRPTSASRVAASTNLRVAIRVIRVICGWNVRPRRSDADGAVDSSERRTPLGHG